MPLNKASRPPARATRIALEERQPVYQRNMEVNLSTPRPEGLDLLKVHPERRLLLYLKRRGFV